MSQIPYRANLSAAVFPMTLAKSGRSVIIPGSDQNFDRRVDPSGEQKDAGIPQAIYLENVLPTPNGYQSVGLIPAYNTAGTAKTVLQSLEVWATFVFGSFAGIRKFVFVFYTDGTIYCLRPNGLYSAVGGPGIASWVVPTDPVTTATVRGVGYIYNPTNNTLYSVDDNTITVVATAGLPTNVIGICGAYNYIIAICENGDVLWSSTTTPSDFVPSLISGAGAEIPTAYRGSYIHVVPHPQGFVIYTFENVIAAAYTGNARYPWKFREISNSSGYVKYPSIAGDINQNLQVAIDASGRLQKLDITAAETAFQEVSDFLQSCRVIDSFNTGTNSFSLQNYDVAGVASSKSVRIAVIANNYVIISYGAASSTSKFQTSYDYALIYDLALNRWGKIKFTHTHVVERGVGVNGRNEILFLQASDSQFFRLSFDITESQTVSGTLYKHDGVILLGKFQLTRARMLQMEELEVESTVDLATVNPKNFSVFLIPSLDGKNFEAAVTPYLLSQIGSLNQYLTHTVGVNVSVLIKGSFDLTSVSMKLQIAGDK